MDLTTGQKSNCKQVTNEGEVKNARGLGSVFDGNAILENEAFKQPQPQPQAQSQNNLPSSLATSK